LFSWASAHTGKGFGVFPALRLTHLIPTTRLTQRYFVRLTQDHAYSHVVLNYELAGVPQQALTLSSYVHVLSHGLRRGLFSMRCQLAHSAAASRFINTHGVRPMTQAASIALNLQQPDHS
jgi:hypothetical protein